MKILKPFFKLDELLDLLVSKVLVVCVLAMLGFSVGSIFLRFFNLSFLWIEPLVRHLVFLSIFLGGVIATGRGAHIGIDILGKYLESSEQVRARKILTAIIGLISSIILFWLSYTSFEFVKVELEFGKEVFWGIHSGYLVMMIPIGFTLIAYRFIIVFFKNLVKVNE